MPPKQRITREMILERSFEMFCREGMDVVNARSVAKALNCSTQPIFSYFSGMEDLKNALVQKARDTFAEALHDGMHADEPVVRLGCAYVRFAAEQPRLFIHLFAAAGEDARYPFSGEEERSDLIAREAAHTGMAQDQARTVFEQVFIYAHGMAAMCATGKLRYAPEEAEKQIAAAHALAVGAVRGAQA